MANDRDELNAIAQRLAKFTPEQVALFGQKMQATIDDLRLRLSEPVAIVGYACRLPGAPSPEAFWELLHNGVEAVQDIPSDRWDAEAYYDANPNAPGKMVTKKGAFIKDVAKFDAAFFGITPHEAKAMDPQQRILIELAWNALEDSGYAPGSFEGAPVGVFVGATTHDYEEFTPTHRMDGYTGVGASYAGALSGRISYTLGFKGPCLTVDTACSSSIVALHSACASLRDRSSDIALMGGVNLVLSPRFSVYGSRARALSVTHRCHTFDASADGYVRGEGAVVFVLKRLSQAIADGDSIRGVIKGTAINHNGKDASSFTAPSADSQTAVFRAALKAAGVNPGDVDYIETHGTGTQLGDPNEIESTVNAYCGERSRNQRLAVGAVKTNIGHLEPASGAAGLLKVVLALQHFELPAHLHLRQVTPFLDFENLPVCMPSSSTPWISTGKARLAAVSAFGATGTNAHAIVEEAPAAPLRTRRQSVRRAFVLSARNSGALRAYCEAYVAHLDANPAADLQDVCFTTNTGRTPEQERLTVVVGSSAELRKELAGFVTDGRSAATAETVDPNATAPRVCINFTPLEGMPPAISRTLIETSPIFRKSIDTCAQIFGVKELVGQGVPQAVAFQIALADLWQACGVRSASVVGAGSGEYAAAYLTGAASLTDIGNILTGRSTNVRLPPALARVPKDMAITIDAGSGLADADGFAYLQEQLAALYRKGVNLRWNPLYADFRRLALPTYPFQGERYWIEREAQQPSVAPAATTSAPDVQRQPAEILSQLTHANNVDRRKLLDEIVRREAAQAMEKGEPLGDDGDVPLLSLGIDSIMAVNLHSRLEIALQRTLPATIVFDCPTLNALTDFLIQPAE